MEESEQRRERLRAMRTEASAAEGCPSLESPAGTGGLANPLIEAPTVHDSSMPRFDYYTDPMAAYSGNRRQSNTSQSPRDNPMPRGAGRGIPVMQFPPSPFGPGNPEMTSQSNYADQRMQHLGRPPYYGPGPIRSPMAFINPHPEHQHHGFINQPGSPSGYHHSGNFSGGPHMPRPGFQWARPGSPSPGFQQGQGNWVNSGPFPNTGRGRGGPRGGHWTNNSPRPVGPGHGSGGRGIGYRGDNTPRNLYKKSMVEDPWKDLKPVVWRGAVSSRIFESYRNPSPSAKKPRAVEACNMSNSKESLADYLASAFDEAVEEGDAL